MGAQQLRGGLDDAAVGQHEAHDAVRQRAGIALQAGAVGKLVRMRITSLELKLDTARPLGSAAGGAAVLALGWWRRRWRCIGGAQHDGGRAHDRGGR